MQSLLCVKHLSNLHNLSATKNNFILSIVYITHFILFYILYMYDINLKSEQNVGKNYDLSVIFFINFENVSIKIFMTIQKLWYENLMPFLMKLFLKQR